MSELITTPIAYICVILIVGIIIESIDKGTKNLSANEEILFLLE